MSTTAGRDREISWITARLDATSLAGTALALISGPPGIGKSHVLHAARDLARLSGYPAFEGHCHPHAAFAPFAAIATQAIAWLRARGESEALAAADLDILSSLVAPRAARAAGDAPQDALVRFVEAVGRLLAAVGRQRPALVLLRGWSRVDEASRSLVRALLDAAGPAGEPTPGAPSVLLLAATRDAATDDLMEHARTACLTLQGLDVTAVRTLLSDPAWIDRLHAATNGNPESILATLMAEPPARLDVALGRLGRLGPLARSVVTALALAERPLPVPVAAAVLGVPAAEVAATVPSLVDAQTVWRDLDPVSGDVVLGLARAEFRHAALTGLTPADRARIHDGLARALAATGRAPPEECLAHRLLGADPAAGAAEAPDVARALLGRHAPVAALRAVQSASRHAQPEVRGALALVAARSALASGLPSEAMDLVRSAIVVEPARAELRTTLAELALAAGDLDACAEALDAAAACPPAPDGHTEAVVECLRAEWAYQRGLLEIAGERAARAVALASENDDLHTRARNTLIKVFMWRGDLDRAESWTQDALARSRTRGVATEALRAVINLGVIAIRRGDLEDASRRFDQAEVLTARGGAMMLRGVLRENQAVVAHLKGRFAEAAALYQEALGVLARVGQRQFLARVANNLGELYAQLGETARARRLCEYAAVTGRGLARGVVAEGLLLRAQIEMLDGRSDAARLALNEALSIFAASGERAREAQARVQLARVALLDGDVTTAARELVCLEDPAAIEVSEPALGAERLRLQAELSRAEGRDPLPVARRAMEAAEQVGDDELRLRAHSVHGLALHDRGDVAAARRACEVAEELRAELLARAPEALRPGYAALLDRSGLSQLRERLAAPVESRSPLLKETRDGRASPVDEIAGLVGESPPMLALRRAIARVAPSDATVLLRGESGTGKERVAEAIHQASRRRLGPLVKVNCAALAEGVLLSELFGHEKGAFTGAAGRRKGRFEAADGGTIFLDEIGDISANMQTALLRVLQERTFERVGGNVPLRVDVRVITATHQDLERLMREGRFREDLYYRLTHVTLRLPTLRDRAEDVPLLARHVLERIARERGTEPKRLSPSALRRLVEHAWPGNVRELGNVLESAHFLTEGDEITGEDLSLPESPTIRAEAPLGATRPSVAPGARPDGRSEVAVVYERIRSGGVSLFSMRRELERGCIARALEETGGNITRAAALLGMKRPRLSQLVSEYGLAPARDAGETSES